MRRSLQSISLLTLLPLTSALCPLYGRTFPYPKNLANSTIVQNALANLTAVFEEGVKTGNSSYGPVNPAAVSAFQIFSPDDEKPLFEFYHDGTTLVNSTGVKTVDGESIFRMGSIGKLYTVYLFLAVLGDGYWDVPVTDVVPELRNRTKGEENPVDFVQWEGITLGALASQQAGITRDSIVFLPRFFQSNPEAFGMPYLKDEELEACSVAPNGGNSCDRAGFFAALDRRQPIFLPNTQAVYSNTGFQILGYALESITGKGFESLFNATFVDTLGLTDTSYSKPANESRGVIPFNRTLADWDFDLGSASPVGNFFTSLNDLSQLGRTILNSTLLPKNTTRAWLKPTSFTSDPRGAVGRPWEIYRSDILPNRSAVDLYGKGGTVGLYQSWFGVVPDYNIGISTYAAGGGGASWMSSLFVEIVIPALEAAAREQANAAYAGTYKGTNGLNSTLTLTTEPGMPGLGVSEWISNGTDFLSALSAVIGNPVDSGFMRIWPTNLETKTGNGTVAAWRAVPNAEPPYARGPFAACSAWLGMDGPSHGDFGFDSILFNLDVQGNARSVDLRAFRAVLVKQGN